MNAGGNHSATGIQSPDIIHDPMELLSRSWSTSALQLAKHSSSTVAAATTTPENADGELEVHGPSIVAGNSFTFACSATSQLVLDRIMSPSEVSRLTVGRLSNGRASFNGGLLAGGSPVSSLDKSENCRASFPATFADSGGSRAVERWLKDRKERKKEAARAHNAQLHAAVSVSRLAAAVAAVAVATAASFSGTGDSASRTNLAVASAATLVAAQCVEAAASLGVDRGHLAAAISSAVSVRSAGDIATLTAAAATALTGAAALKATVLKEMWNIAAVIPSEKRSRNHEDAGKSTGEMIHEDDFLGLYTQELLARGSKLLKRTRKGSLHWKMVSVNIHRTGQVKLKMKSRHAAGTITKKKKSVVTEVCKEVPAWPGRHSVDDGKERWYFGLKTAEERVIEFECRGRWEYEMWTQGVSRLLSLVGDDATAAPLKSSLL
ncbi:hypothetical protein HPP92_006120 [Vanilla planifolia]|uniref:VAN3-binding protein n=1 Tax=Vanilla planifolia TaxID=51239 RepID=A0A835RVV1_VANPL|nr:hypothetical protein HPP92_006120 [Vanilla planifolia]